jgi:hypothetical protein
MSTETNTRPIIDGEVVRLGGQEFPCDDIGDSFESFIPKKVLSGFRLSEIPEDLIINPVEFAAGRSFEINHNIGLSFVDSSASAFVHVSERRKLWDGDMGLRVYMEALQQAIHEREDAETWDRNLNDDGDYISLTYCINVDENMEIQNAISHVENVIGEIEKRGEQIAQETLMKKWQEAA